MEKSEKKVLVTGDTVSTDTVIEGKELEKEVEEELKKKVEDTKSEKD